MKHALDSLTPPSLTYLLERRTASTPDERLRLAVLEDALRILVHGDVESERSSFRLMSETREWVLADDLAWPFSFRNICDALDIDADGLRLRLAPWVAPRHRRHVPISPWIQDAWSAQASRAMTLE